MNAQFLVLYVKAGGTNSNQWEFAWALWQKKSRADRTITPHIGGGATFTILPELCAYCGVGRRLMEQYQSTFWEATIFPDTQEFSMSQDSTVGVATGYGLDD
jgi:hypothetical protein